MPTKRTLYRDALLPLLLAACGSKEVDSQPLDSGEAVDSGETGEGGDTGDTWGSCDSGETGSPDADGDGTSADVDCDDTDPTSYPGALETCGDGVDQDCDGADSACGLSGALDAGAPDARVDGDQRTYAGLEVATVDVDGDGRHDLSFSAYEGGRNPAAIYTFTSINPGDRRTLAEADVMYFGNADAVRVAGPIEVGDVDGDGLADVAYSDMLADGDGRIQMFGGVRAGTLDPGAAVGGLKDAAGLLFYRPSAGDLDGDGHPDVTSTLLGGAQPFVGVYLGVGAEWRNSESTDGRVREGDGDSPSCGTAILPDTDGDGLADLLVSATRSSPSSGVVALLPGPADDVGTIADLASVVYWHSNDYLAGDCADAFGGAGDVDGDGLEDLFIGDPYGPGWSHWLGAVFVHLGGSVGDVDLYAAEQTISGSAEGDRFGYAVVDGHDLDRDGGADLLVVGGDSSTSGPTTAWLVPSDLSGSFLVDDVQALVLSSSGSGLDVAAVAAGDLDGDGAYDLAYGMPYDGRTATYAGSAGVFLAH